MASISLVDGASRQVGRVAKWTPKKKFHPGGSPGKLHREIGVPVGDKIPAKKLEAAAHSKDTEIRNDAIRAKTMSHWHKGGAKRRRSVMYTHKEA